MFPWLQWPLYTWVNTADHCQTIWLIQLKGKFNNDFIILNNLQLASAIVNTYLFLWSTLPYGWWNSRGTVRWKGSWQACVCRTPEFCSKFKTWWIIIIQFSNLQKKGSLIWPCLCLKKLSYENSLQLSSCIFPGYTLILYPLTTTCIFLYISLHVVQFSVYVLYMH